MAAPKRVHLAYGPEGAAVLRTACGFVVREGISTTRDPDEVECVLCKRLINLGDRGMPGYHYKEQKANA